MIIFQAKLSTFIRIIYLCIKISSNEKYKIFVDSDFDIRILELSAKKQIGCGCFGDSGTSKN